MMCLKLVIVDVVMIGNCNCCDRLCQAVEVLNEAVEVLNEAVDVLLTVVSVPRGSRPEGSTTLRVRLVVRLGTRLGVG